MTTQTDQQLAGGLASLLSSLADRRNGDAVSGQQAITQLIPYGNPVDPNNFTNAVAPTNPNGSLTTSETFSRLVDTVPAAETVYVATIVSADSMYGQIISLASFPAQQTSTQAIVARSTATMAAPEAMPATSDEQTSDEDAYVRLLSTLPSSHFQGGKAPANAQSQAAHGMEATPPTTSTTARLFSYLQQLYQQTQLVSNISGLPWHLSYAVPSNWCDASATCFIKVSWTSDQLKSAGGTTSTTAFQSGLWHISSSASDAPTGATTLQIDMEVAIVQVERPWLNGTAFSVGGWSMGDAYAKGGISPGNLTQAAEDKPPMPLLPTAVIVARNINISGDWNAADQGFIQKALAGKETVGWGPFCLSSPAAKGQTTFANGAVNTTGLQIIGWISQVVPYCPPL